MAKAIVRSKTVLTCCLLLLPLWESVIVLCFFCTLLYARSSFAIYLEEEERAGCFAWFVLLVSRDCCVALPRCAMGLSAVCNCGIS